LSYVVKKIRTVAMILNILKGSLQPKLKGANVWPFNARSKVARG